MTDAPKKPRGILKKTTTPVGPLATDVEAREVAIKHAHIIHHRRELEDTITDSIILLAKFPLELAPRYSSSNPSPTDAMTFKSHVRLFQPGDYEDLIEERNTNNLCGYTLCPKPRTHVAQTGDFKLVNYGRKDFSIVHKKEIERWCSQACARKAMYIKVQLNETAAWERIGIESIAIDLYEEPKKVENDAEERLEKDLEGLKVETERKAAKDALHLALERGDTADQKKNRSLVIKIKEKATGEAAEPILGNDEDGHLVMEGHKTRFEAHNKPTSEHSGGEQG